jgi:hypothetical protein
LPARRRRPPTSLPASSSPSPTTPGGPYFIEFELDLDNPVVTPPATTGTYIWRMLVTPYVDGTTTLSPTATFEARSRVFGAARAD